MARTRKQTCDVTGMTTSVNNFYNKQNHVKAVDNLRRVTGANKDQLRRMFERRGGGRVVVVDAPRQGGATRARHVRAAEGGAAAAGKLLILIFFTHRSVSLQ